MAASGPRIAGMPSRTFESGEVIFRQGHAGRREAYLVHDGKVEVRLKRMGDNAVIEIEDSGCGMDDQFMRERLFRPFDSTKGTGMGIGAYECREYIRELGGQVEVSSEPSRGTTFQLKLPLEAGSGKPHEEMQG